MRRRQLRAAAPQAKLSPPEPSCNAMINRLLLSLLVAAMVTACATSPTGRRQFLLVSPEQAIVESRQAYAATLQELDADDKFLDDPATADRIAVITGRLVAKTAAMFPHTRNWDWSVALIDDPENVNAWCMAGGKMAIYSGFFSRLDATDDELAQVMAHEISHAVANHSAERMSRALAQQLGVLAVGASTRDWEKAQSANLLATVALQLPNSRATETEADRMGIEIAARAGYDPSAAASLWQKMEAVGGAWMPQFLRTHPKPANRRATLEALAPLMRPLLPDVPPAPLPVKLLP